MFLAIAVYATFGSGSAAFSTPTNGPHSHTSSRVRRGEDLTPLPYVITSVTSWREQEEHDEAAAGIGKQKKNCFVHEMTATSDFFQAGKLRCYICMC